MARMETNSDENPEAARRKSISAAHIAGIIAVLCLLYVLSIGPVMGMMLWAGATPDGPAIVCFCAAYAPILYLDDHTPLQGAIGQYIGWWGRLGAAARR
jgi:hypothetical protein